VVTVPTALKGKISTAISETFLEKLIIIVELSAITVIIALFFDAFISLTSQDIGIESYIHKIPDSMTSEDAAPLQCAGSTVYNAIISSAKPGDRIGVVGIGGLGHLAIQFAAKLGYQTVVFSTSRAKEDEAKSFGASEFYLLDEPEKIASPVNVLIVTSGRYPDWSKFVLPSSSIKAFTSMIC
jgi:Zn-dependent alcohol dehydrogenase